MQPRTPTEEEKNELVAYFVKAYYTMPSSDDTEQERSHVENAAIAVFDGYITDGPGYAGKLMMVVWSGSPAMYTTLIWNDGVLHEVSREA